MGFAVCYCMRQYRKKFVLILVVTLCLAGVCAVSGAEKAGEAKPLFADKGALFANEPNLAVSSADEFSSRGMFFRMMLTVVFVIILGIGAVYVSKKFLPKLTHPSGKRVRVIETTHLGPRKTVHLLQIDDKQILIGSTSDSITKLADVNVSIAQSQGQ
ncbi:FliO/MopB family protein [Planctomycetota bacterium]